MIPMLISGLRSKLAARLRRGRGRRTCVLLARVLLGDAGGRGLRKLELLHHLGGQETDCRTVDENTECTLSGFKLSFSTYKYLIHD